MVQNFSGFVNLPLPLPLTPAMAELTLNGAFIIQVEAEKVVSGSCYFDRVTVAEQLQAEAISSTASELVHASQNGGVDPNSRPAAA
jgi:hypothetical protein